MSVKVLEPAFQGVGFFLTCFRGIEIWRIDNSQPVLLPQSDYGRFYSGDSYIVLKTAGKAGAYTYDIHFWLGKDTSQDEAGTAAMKAVELDAILGNRAVHYRELQSYESNRFLSYFRPCLMPLEGGFSSGLKPPEEENYETRTKFHEGKCNVAVVGRAYVNQTMENNNQKGTQEDQTTASQLATTASQLATSMFKSLKCRTVQGRLYQGKEPPQFVAIF
ncbi:hypothetical protein L1987_51029 [Smallanthus sonchifolius]|uniref:Uncharacterized protein n=1 Tax=Smallanthus sonchifolius TaxID=185202 RepID=A0ACB9EQA3_9ASTR|nr:hypothetical protein L1987_51029 [Smallanthus sonchifolius]